VYEPHRVRVVGERHDPQKIASLKMMAHLARLQGCTDAAELFASMADDMEAGQPDWSLVAKNGPPPPCNPSTMPPSLLCTLHPHPLKKLPAVYTGVYSCDVCDGTGHGWVFHCDACSWDAHPACAAQHCSPPLTPRGGGESDSMGRAALGILGPMFGPSAIKTTPEIASQFCFLFDAVELRTASRGSSKVTRRSACSATTG
jgi:hypothetical protein